MARRNNNKMSMRKIEPAVLTLAYSIPAGAPGVNRIDLSQSASILNRRFYRQGLNWAVAGFRLITPTTVTGSLSVTKLPNTWVMSGAWHKSFATWMKMNREALEETPSVRPRFLDFKVFADAAHHQEGFGANLLPISSLGVPATSGEWTHSSLQMPNARQNAPGAGSATYNEYDFIATGASYPGISPVTTNDAVSLIEGYAASRGLPDVLDPNAPDDADDAQGSTPENWMSALFNDGIVQDAEVLEQMITENNIAPYPFENDGVNLDTMYPGGANQLIGLEYHDSAFVTGTTIGGVTSVRGTNFPCGLITVSHDLTAPVGAAGVILQVMLVPGEHRGYMAESMQDM